MRLKCSTTRYVINPKLQACFDFSKQCNCQLNGSSPDLLRLESSIGLSSIPHSIVLETKAEMMASSSYTHTYNGDACSLPPETLMHIFSFLPTFSDIAAFASTCRHMHNFWLENSDTVYQRALKDNIECEAECRALLVYQGNAMATKQETKLSNRDVCCLIRNSRKAAKSADRFGKEIASRVTSMSAPRALLNHLGTHKLNIL